MKIRLITVGERMPAWVDQAFDEYVKRLPKQYLTLHTVPIAKRHKNYNAQQVCEQEGQTLLAACQKNAVTLALDLLGQAWSTTKLAERLEHFSMQTSRINLLVGGPEGLSTACKNRADLCWSLSPLTFPHPLVRVIVAEQIYRAWSLQNGHPYAK